MQQPAAIIPTALENVGQNNLTISLPPKFRTLKILLFTQRSETHVLQLVKRNVMSVRPHGRRELRRTPGSPALFHACS